MFLQNGRQSEKDIEKLYLFLYTAFSEVPTSFQVHMMALSANITQRRYHGRIYVLAVTNVSVSQ